MTDVFTVELATGDRTQIAVALRRIAETIDARDGHMARWDRGPAFCGDLKVGSWSYAPHRGTT